MGPYHIAANGLERQSVITAPALHSSFALGSEYTFQALQVI